jgi:hypothetical protein
MDLPDDEGHVVWVSGSLVSSDFEASFVIDGLEDIEAEVSDGGHVSGSMSCSGSGFVLVLDDFRREPVAVLDGFRCRDYRARITDVCRHFVYLTVPVE